MAAMQALTRPALARRIIDRTLYLTLATAGADGMPWCTPVYTAFSTRYEFYWGSGRDAQHSRNIRENPHVGAVLYDSSAIEGSGEGVYMKGLAQELSPDECEEGLNVLRTRSAMADTFYPLQFYLKDTSVRIYRLQPSDFYMLMPGGDPDSGAYTDKRERIDVFGV